jgi:hypothetical protein
MDKFMAFKFKEIKEKLFWHHNLEFVFIAFEEEKRKKINFFYLDFNFFFFKIKKKCIFSKNKQK